MRFGIEWGARRGRHRFSWILDFRSWCLKLLLEIILMGTSKNSRHRSDATKLPANDSASFPFRFIDVHCRLARDRQREQFFEVPLYVDWLSF